MSTLLWQRASSRRSARGAALILVALVALLGVGRALAHGINGHVHVTGWAIESLPPGPLRAFFQDAALRDAAMIGAAFPDSGYAISDGYGELAHWEPFIEAYVRWVRETHGPDFATPEARQHVAFLMGVSAHGLQDEIFDSVFLHAIAQHDGAGQDEADPGTDAFLFTDGHLRFLPPLVVPYDDLVALFATAANHVVDRRTMEAGMARVHRIVITNFAAIAPSLDARYRPQIPWAAAHYMDAAVPGSLASEIPATAAYLEALWDRLHDRYEPRGFVSHPYPAPGRRLRGRVAGETESWVTLVFGIGVRTGSLTPDRVGLNDAEGAPVPYTLRHTRWSGRPDDSTRLLQLRPLADLAPDAEYEVRIEPGAELQDGRVTDETWSWRFRTVCEPVDACPDVPEDRPLVRYDGGVEDAGAPDAGAPDAGAPDAGAPDAGPTDARAADAVEAPGDRGPPTPDRGLPADADPRDAASPPLDSAARSMTDATPAGAEARSGGSSGCAIHRPGQTPSPPGAPLPPLIVSALLAIWVRRAR